MQSDLIVTVCKLNKHAWLFSIIGILYITVIADKTSCRWRIIGIELCDRLVVSLSGICLIHSSFF